MKKEKAIRITCEVNKMISPTVIECLKELNIFRVHIQTGRAIVLSEKKRVFSLPAKTIMEDDPLDIFRFYITSDMEDYVLDHLIQKCKLNISGRGSVYSEDVTLYMDALSLIHTEVKKDLPVEKQILSTDLVFINCTVQRGEGDTIIRSALDMGFSVPVCTYGEGTGLRDKLGLLRITIPAEKEVINLVVDARDTQEVMDYLIDEGKLDQPGKGFILNTPIKKGLINCKILRGSTGHAASTEQIIAAIDGLEGNTEWRRRDTDLSSTKKQRQYLTNLVNLQISCNQGFIEDLVEEAMNAGAGGATIFNQSFLNLTGKEEPGISPAREYASLAISEKSLDKITDALVTADLFSKKINGQLDTTPAPQACTYLGGAKK